MNSTCLAFCLNKSLRVLTTKYVYNSSKSCVLGACPLIEGTESFPVVVNRGYQGSTVITHLVVICPYLLATVVRRVDANALHLASVIRQEGLQGYKVIAFDKEIATIRIADRKFRDFFQEMKRDLVVMSHNSFLAYP